VVVRALNTLQTAQANVHSALALVLPRTLSWRKPMLFLMWPCGVSAMWDLDVDDATLVFLFVLGAGKYAANVDLIRVGGWLGFVAGAEAAYLSCAELCQIAYKREVLPIWSLAK
jgi:succinate-acetate transporter protein